MFADRGAMSRRSHFMPTAVSGATYANDRPRREVRRRNTHAKAAVEAGLRVSIPTRVADDQPWISEFGELFGSFGRLREACRDAGCQSLEQA